MNAAATTHQHTNCLRCGRTLTSAKSQATGYGPKCAAKVRRSPADLSDYKPHQITSARELIADGAIVPLRSVVFIAVSTDGTETYKTAHRLLLPRRPEGLPLLPPARRPHAARRLTREEPAMTELNLDTSKDYDHEHSEDGGRTWIPTNTNCSAMVVADVLYAEEQGNPITVTGQVVVIDEGTSLTRWTPRS
ncbi:DUF6011 domain-containing protein [Streptomyces sp. MS1.AVA.1]|uniref:DUF6011 domain-containing protein n=1 Tax=Streptomyces machairae TaxID=3134109 RepID=A0ABU8USK3_9ACTN